MFIWLFKITAGVSESWSESHRVLAMGESLAEAYAHAIVELQRQHAYVYVAENPTGKRVNLKRGQAVILE